MFPWVKKASSLIFEASLIQIDRIVARDLRLESSLLPPSWRLAIDTVLEKIWS
jgi:hypothetical protein